MFMTIDESYCLFVTLVDLFHVMCSLVKMPYKSGDHFLVQPKCSSKLTMINSMRKIIRNTFRTVYEAENTIRGQYGITDTRNCGHGSG